ncbi:MAG: ABC transporter ATP-binding protein [Rikenellaceae bacterium]
MVRVYLKLLGFARPIGKYIAPYFICAVLYAVFNTFNYAMIIPILKTLFLDGFEFSPIYELPQIKVNAEGYNTVINYIYTLFFGGNFKMQNMLILLASITLLMTILSNVFKYMCSMTVEDMRKRTLERLRNKIFDHLMDMSVGYLGNQRKGNIIAKATSDVANVQSCITNTLQVAIREPFLILGYIIAMISISWQLSIFSVLFLPLVAMVIGTIVKNLRHPARRVQEINAQMVGMLDESLTGTKIIKGYNATEYMKNKYHEASAAVADTTLAIARSQQLASPASETMGVAAIGVIIVFGGALVASGDLNAASFLAFIAIFSQITRPMRTIIDQFTNFNQGIAAGERVLELLEEKSTVTDKEDAIEMKGFSDKIEFRDVHFGYEKSREVIKGVSFTVNKGETVALVGPSGGGKSTLGELVPRFWDIKSGEILIDGVPITELKQDSLRSHMGLVTQDTILFNDTIANNLSLSRRDATLDEIKEAAKVANAHTFIMETKKKYNTNIGDRGMKLSGGQRQRLSIARAVLKNPEILILDEATSALDTESEKLVQDALSKLLKGRTSIVVAHRLSTIFNADKILVIDKGIIAESGTHAELIAKNGIYAKLVEMQSFD